MRLELRTEAVESRNIKKEHDWNHERTQRKLKKSAYGELKKGAVGTENGREELAGI